TRSCSSCGDPLLSLSWWLVVVVVVACRLLQGLLDGVVVDAVVLERCPAPSVGEREGRDPAHVVDRRFLAPFEAGQGRAGACDHEIAAQVLRSNGGADTGSRVGAATARARGDLALPFWARSRT